MNRHNARLVEEQSLPKQRLRIWLRLLKTTRHVEGLLRENLRTSFDTTLPRFDVMAALYREKDGMKMSELSAALMVSNGNVTGIIARLVEDGLVDRVPVEGDRRAMQVRLTRKGVEQFATMAEIHEAWVGEILSGLNVDETEQLITLLGKLSQHEETK